MAVKATQIQKGGYLLFKGAPHRVMKASFYNPGKGSAVVRTRLKNVVSGNTIDFTYKSNEMVDEVEVEKKEMQFLYADENEVVFMNPNNYEQLALKRDLVDDMMGFLTPEIMVNVMVYQDDPIGVVLPPNVTLTVTEAHEAVAGNRVNAPKKPVLLETGLEIQVPLFIKTGDRVMVDTDSGEYLARSTER